MPSDQKSSAEFLVTFLKIAVCEYSVQPLQTISPPLKSIPRNFPGAAADFQTSYTSTANKNFFAHDSNLPL